MNASNKIWQMRKDRIRQSLIELAGRSPVLSLVGHADCGSETRSIVAFNTKTLVRRQDGTIDRAGPVVIGIRYHRRFLTEVPHPMEIVTVLEPRSIFHPNATAATFCLGHPPVGITIETVVNQVFAGLMFNMNIVNTLPGQIVNPEAANYVRSTAKQFPLTRKGLFENPDEDLANSNWQAIFDPKLHTPLEMLGGSSPNKGANDDHADDNADDHA
jgi:hypothetical protein